MSICPHSFSPPARPNFLGAKMALYRLKSCCLFYITKHITAEHPEKKNVTILSTRFNIYKSRQRISLFFDNNIFEAKLIFAQNLAKSSPTPLYTDLNSMFNSKICNAELESSTIARTENEISNKSEKYPTHFFNFKNNVIIIIWLWKNYYKTLEWAIQFFLTNYSRICQWNHFIVFDSYGEFLKLFKYLNKFVLINPYILYQLFLQKYA